MPRKLDKYAQKRNFGATPEPSDEAPVEEAAAPRFVVQEHSARSMHWDLRLERDGVAVSWAVPRGLPALPKINHLAKQTEDHPLKYLEFEGDIPQGNYGAGSMRIYDHGTYELEIWNDDKVQVVLDGERLKGRYGLVRTRDSDWLVHRMEPPSDPTRKPLPEDVEPMTAQAKAEPPAGDGWAYEIKWDGIRALVWASGGRIDRIRSRNGIDITPRYPELARLGRQVGAHDAILDGEIVAFDDDGRPSFSLLQERMQLTKETAIRRKVKTVPVSFVIFDILFLDGHDTTSLPYRDRRRLLELLELNGDAWQTPPYDVGSGQAMLEEAHELGLEGVMGKRLDSPYVPGKRAGSWVKVKLQRRQEFVIGGWIEGEGRRSNGIGSLAVGYYPPAAGPDARLMFAGGVGTGYTDAMLALLQEQLGPLETDTSPFDPEGPEVQSGGGRWGRRKVAARVHWVEPRLVCEVEYTEFTHERVLRHPSFKGLRDDKDPRSVVLEDVRALAAAGDAGLEGDAPRVGDGPLRGGQAEGRGPETGAVPGEGSDTGQAREDRATDAAVARKTGPPQTSASASGSESTSASGSDSDSAFASASASAFASRGRKDRATRTAEAPKTGAALESDPPSRGPDDTATPAPPPAKRGTGKRGEEFHTYELDGQSVRLSNPSKVLYPAPGFTKQQIVEYLLGIAPVMLPHLRDRPLTMKRYPEGVDKEFFFEKNAPSHRPDWMRTALVPRREDAAREDDMIQFLLVDNPAGLVWVSNLASIELHVPMARAQHITRPDMVVFDLDPGAPATIVECCQVAFHLREICEATGLRLWPKTSGRTGLQLYLPLNDPDVTYQHTRTFSNAVARLLERQYPSLVVSKMTKSLRTGKVLVDWSQNHETKTTIGVYSLRENEQPTVSTPVTWEEVQACHDAADPTRLRFTAPEVLKRVREHGDLFADVLTVQQQLPRV